MGQPQRWRFGGSNLAIHGVEGTPPMSEAQVALRAAEISGYV